MAEVVTPELQVDAARHAYAAFADSARSAQPHDVDALLAWLRAEGFGSDPVAQATLSHSDIYWVLRHRAGIPISLAVLLMTAARRCGLACHGINYPGHFLVAADGALIDPLKMQLIDPARKPDAAALDPATPHMLGLRMLNNVKAQYMHARDWSQALAVIDYQMSLCGGAEAELSASLHYERGELWQQLGVNDFAREAFLACAAASPYRQLSEKALDRAADLDGAGAPRWH